ncbi:hypothetical protein MHU86_7093 [Fragilaria crotonensis]|nr:hypothetical protein MHU86_7093 [Fragilaria crotonensis]
MMGSRSDKHNQSLSRDSTRLSNQILDQIFNPFGDTGFSLLGQRETYTPSTVSASSSSPSTPNSKSFSTFDQSHLRASVENSQRKVAPQTSNPPSRLTPPPKPRREAGWNDDEMPFDQLGPSRPVPLCTPPRYLSPMQRTSYEPSACADAYEDELVILCSDSSPDTGLFETGGYGRRDKHLLPAYDSDYHRCRSASPPSILTQQMQYPSSPPYALSLAQSDATMPFLTNCLNIEPCQLPFISNATDEAVQNYEEFDLSPGSATDSSPRKLSEARISEVGPSCRMLGLRR